VTLLRPRVEALPVYEPDAEALIREARRRRRRRWTIGTAIVALIAGTGIGLGVGLTSIKPTIAPPYPKAATPAPSRSTSTIARGLIPKTPAALAVGRNGDLYLVDTGRDEILRRPPNGRFQVVAGTGEPGFSGDGGLAVDAMVNLAYDAGIAVANNGTVYFSDSLNDRVREVLPDGVIETIAGGGTTPLGEQPVSALAASLASGIGTVAGLAIGPDGDLFLALPGGVYQLTSVGMLERVAGGPFNLNDVQAWDTNPAVENDFSPAYRLAFDRAGDLFMAGGGGWGLYEQTSAGALRFVENFRGNGAGFWGSLATDPNGSVVAVSNRGIEISSVSGQMQPLTADPTSLAKALDRALGRLPKPAPTGIDTNTFLGGSGIAMGADGTIYVDMDESVWSRASGILAVSPDGHVSTVWLSTSSVG
jgi:hypothetical protein